jgi:adenylyltransferase/sulfurtransferase
VACGQQKLEYLEGGSAVRADTNTVLCGRDAVQIQTDSTTVDFQHLADRWQNIGRVQKTRFFVRLYPDDSHSLTMFRDGRVVVTGTDQVSEAKTLLHRFIGG